MRDEEVRLQQVLSTILTHLRRDIEGFGNTLPSTPRPFEYFDISNLVERLCANLPPYQSAALLRTDLLTICGDLLKASDQRRFSADLTSKEGPVLEHQMRALTGAWFGLYFLGVPFVHVWEPVARHAERHGYFRRAGIFKAAGDVYREARRELSRTSHPEPVLVMDSNPLAYSSLVMDDTSAIGLESIVAALGACYEMLQLRLYLRAHGPIEHFVLRSTVKRLLTEAPRRRSDMKGQAPASSQSADGGLLSGVKEPQSATSGGATVPPESETLAMRSRVEERAQAMWKLACHSYGIGTQAHRIDQRIIIVPDDRARVASQLPSCILGPTKGVFRSRIVAPDGLLFGANGSHLGSSQFRVFRTILVEAGKGAVSVTSGTRAGFLRECNEIAGVEPTT